MFEQRTITKNVKFSGVGLHSGKMTNVVLKPSEAGSGISFIRSDISVGNVIQANFKNVSEVLYSTKLSNENGVCVQTIEHLMAAIWAMKISNLVIEIDSEEIPIMDGCSQSFIFLFESIGIKKQGVMRPMLKIKKEIKIEKEDGRSVSCEPSNEFIASFFIKNKHKIIENGSGYEFNAQKSSFINDISLARTYCDFDDIEKLKSMNLAKGGGLHNAVVVKDGVVLNEDGLNYKSEFVRHKILDLIGDISLCNYYILGKFTGKNSGHGMNNELMRKIFDNKDNYEIIL